MNDTATIAEDDASEAVARAEHAAATFTRVRDGVAKVIFGQNDVIDQTLVTLLAGGHGLLIGVPGLAKTRLVETLGIVLGLDWKRIQFTPDLMPADIIGSEVLEEKSGKRSFRFLKGPVFTQLLMADEINRASPRTQSALLQAMQERQVTVAGTRYDLPQPFHVLATQNPLEQEGTYPLPEAQLDRFLLQIDIGYPDKDAEKRMMLATTFGEETAPTRVCTPTDLLEAQKVVRFIPVGEKVVDAILRLVRAARPDADGPKDIRESVSWGPGPRASQAFMLAVRARALIDGRLAPSTDDVVALAQPVLRHRMALSFSARAEGLTVSHVVDRLCRELLLTQTLQHEAEALSAALPPLLADAERLASAVSLGIHGRRKAGMGESFWQFRRFRDEDPSTAVDWRQSAKSQHLFVREREWEVAQSVWFWRDGSPGMGFKSGAVRKRDRASLLALALASALVRGGERIAFLGDSHAPASSRVALRRMALSLSAKVESEALPPEAPMSRNAQFVWLSDFLSSLPALERVFARFTQSGISGYLVHIVDPAEEDFPYEGRTRFEAPGGELSETLGRAKSVASSYRARFKAHSETVALLARRQGWTYLAHRTDRAPQTALVALYAEMSGAAHARV